jgi:hypothetical protein
MLSAYVESGSYNATNAGHLDCCVLLQRHSVCCRGSESVGLAGGSPLRLTVGVDTGFCNPFLGVTGELLLDTGFGLQVDGLVHYNAYGLYVTDKFISSG